MDANWWTAWALANLTPVVICIVIVLWMRGLWRRQLERAGSMLTVARENSELLRQSNLRLEEIRELLRSKP